MQDVLTSGYTRPWVSGGQELARSLCTSDSGILGMEAAEKPQSFWDAKLAATRSRVV